jgi:hypothetical protein
MRHREVQHRGPRHARPVETAAGLGRRTPTNQSAFRRSVPDLATRQVKSRLLFTHADSTSHPVARCEPLPPRQRLAGRFELSRPRPAPHGLPRASPCRRERCVSPTSATDLRHEHPRAARFPMVNHRVELRLTANLQLQLRCDPPDRLPRGRSPVSPAWFEHCAFLGELRSRAPPRRASRPRPSQPPNEHAAPPLTPSVATAPLELDLSASLALTAARHRFHRRLVKGNRFAGTRTPSLDDHSPRLQPEQPTSTTTNHPIPARPRRLGLPSSRWTDRVGAPSAASTAASG